MLRCARDDRAGACLKCIIGRYGGPEEVGECRHWARWRAGGVWEMTSSRPDGGSGEVGKCHHRARRRAGGGWEMPSSLGSCLRCLPESGQTCSVALSRVDCTTFVSSHSSYCTSRCCCL